LTIFFRRAFSVARYGGLSTRPMSAAWRRRHVVVCLGKPLIVREGWPEPQGATDTQPDVQRNFERDRRAAPQIKALCSGLAGTSERKPKEQCYMSLKNGR